MVYHTAKLQLLKWNKKHRAASVSTQSGLNEVLLTEEHEIQRSMYGVTTEDQGLLHGQVFMWEHRATFFV